MAKCKLKYGSVVVSPIIEVLTKAKSEITNGKLKDIVDKKKQVLITCPNSDHKDGRESKPSCYVYDDSGQYGTTLEHGTFHCFSCGCAGNLVKLVSLVFDEDEDFADKWLNESFGQNAGEVNEQEMFHALDDVDKLLAPRQNTVKSSVINEKILDKYRYRNDYLLTRGISERVMAQFDIGFDPIKQVVTFPVYNENKELVLITERSIKTKNFYIDESKTKPVYLLYDIIERNVDTVFVVESQINALTLRTWGIDSVALFGTGDPYQYDLLKKSGVRNFVLCFDGDFAGRKGASRFIKEFGKTHLIYDILMPNGKDVNDLTKQEFMDLLNSQVK